MFYEALRWKRMLVTTAALVAGPVLALAALPKQQQAIVQVSAGGPEVLQMQTIPVLSPGPGQVLIRIFAAGVNPHDWKYREQGEYVTRPTALPPMVPGVDVAGVIAALGTGVSGFKLGEPVFGTLGEHSNKDGQLNGADAHFVVTDATNIAPKPKQLTYEEAAGLGLIAWTAGRAMEESQLRPGKRVLITGAAGGVGSAAAQIAVARGAHVIGTASPQHFAFLRSLGVSEVVDYHDPDWIKRVGQVDAALDTVGDPSAAMTISAIKPRGGIFTTTNPHEVTPEEYAAAEAAGIICPDKPAPDSYGNMARSDMARKLALGSVGVVHTGPPSPPARPAGPFLQQVAELVRAGKFTVHVDRAYPLAEVAQAQVYSRARHTEGKIILIITDQAKSR